MAGSTAEAARLIGSERGVERRPWRPWHGAPGRWQSLFDRLTHYLVSLTGTVRPGRHSGSGLTVVLRVSFDVVLLLGVLYPLTDNNALFAFEAREAFIV